ncbi:hypothetical protein C7S13_3025 [Burkholderia cepacia]|nr:hypothetical protein [Burkholderia cepacia]
MCRRSLSTGYENIVIPPAGMSRRANFMQNSHCVAKPGKRG